MSDTTTRKVEANLFVRGIEQAADMLGEVRGYLLDDEMRAATLLEMGLNPTTELPQPAPVEAPPLPADAGRDALFARIAALVKLADEIKAFSDRAHTNSTEAVADEVFALLSLEYFRLRVPVVYFFAQAGALLLESIELGSIPRAATDEVEAVGRQFVKAVEHPVDRLKTLWHLFADFPFKTEAEAKRAADILFGIAALVPPLIEGQTTDVMYGWDPDPASTTPIGDALANRTLALRCHLGGGGTEITPAFAFQFIPEEHGGPGLLLSFSGSVSQTIDLGDSWEIKIDVDSPAAFDLLLRPGWKPEAFSSAGGGSPQASVALVMARKEGALNPPVLSLNDGVRIEFGEPSIALKLTPSSASLAVRAAKTALVIDGKSDPVTERTMAQGGWRGSADTALQLFPEFAFSGSGGLEAHIPFNEGVGPVDVPYLLLGIRTVDGQPGATLELSAAMTARLGPITLTLDRVGLNFHFKSWSDIDAGFQSPRGIGVAIDAKGTVKGGGFLSFDPDTHQYAGVLDLRLSSGTLVTAIGLVTTRPVFSLLAILTVENSSAPPMGPGFRLTGLGGLIGLDRTVDFEALKRGVANKTLDRIMFPPNPIANAPAIISTSTAVFPVLRGHIIIGFMAQFTWGVGKLLTLELALICEMPLPSRFIILGKLRLNVPDPDHALVRIHVDLVGEINVAKKTAFVLAKLVDSKITKFDLKGSAAIYVSWGADPTFICSFGGFNPRYHLPQGVPPEMASLERLSVSLARDPHLELTFAAYLAFTPNTFQVGGSIHAFASAGKFSIDGFLSVEALIDRHEGTFFIDLEARLQLKAWGVNLFMVSFKGTLTGPVELRLKGKATFSIWIFDYSVPINIGLGGTGAPVSLPVVEVLPLLLAELRSPQNWVSELPSGAQAPVRLRPTGESEFVLHPLGRLTIRQSVVPLGVAIDRYGRSRPHGAARFEIAGVSVAGQEAATQGVHEHFARSEFFDLSEEQAYGGPSFEAMPAGVTVGTVAVTSGPAVTVPLHFQTFIYDPVDDRMEPVPDYALPDGHLNVLLTIGAAARKASGYMNASGDGTASGATGAIASTAVVVVTPGYVVASAETFSTPTTTIVATTYTAAAQALRLQVVHDPKLKGTLTVASSEVAA